MSTVYGRHVVRWRGLALHRGQAKRPLLHVVPDAVHPEMWRVQYPDGRLTDMVNLTRAKDAAVSIALGMLAAASEVQETPQGEPPSAFEPDPLGEVATEPQSAPATIPGTTNQEAMRSAQSNREDPIARRLAIVDQELVSPDATNQRETFVGPHTNVPATPEPAEVEQP
jgi:hypothetical protein